MRAARGRTLGVGADRSWCAEALPGARNLNVESNFEYGSRVGFWEIMRLLKSAGAPATVFAVGMALERNPAVAAEIARSGFEVACHGQRWIDYQFVPEAVERADMLRNIEAITRLIGRTPGGLVHRPPGPEHAAPGGGERRLPLRQRRLQRRPPLLDARSSGKRHLVVPYSFDTNDSRLQRGGDFSTGEELLHLLPGRLRLALPHGSRRAAAHDVASACTAGSSVARAASGRWRGCSSTSSVTKACGCAPGPPSRSTGSRTTRNAEAGGRSVTGCGSGRHRHARRYRSCRRHVRSR